MTYLKDKLNQLDACRDAVEWVGDITAEQAWQECERGDWMLWIADQAGIDLRTTAVVKVSALGLRSFADPYADAARRIIVAQCADICREQIPLADVLAGLGLES